MQNQPNRLATYLHVHLVSDSTGETLNAMARAACARIDCLNPIEHIYSLVRSPRQLEKVMEEIENAPGLVIHTLYDPELRLTLELFCAKNQIKLAAALDNIIETFSQYISEIPDLKRLEQSPIGHIFEPAADKLKICDPESKSDQIAADSDTTQQIHSDLLSQVPRLIEHAYRIKNLRSWENFYNDIKIYYDLINRPSREIPSKLGSIYSSLIICASYIDLDNRISLDVSQNTEPLDAPTRSALSRVIMLSASWIRRFPTARELDDNILSFIIPNNVLRSSARILRGAKTLKLISNDDNVIVESLITQDQDAPAGKRSIRGVLTIQNLIIAAAKVSMTVYLGAVSSAMSDQWELSKKSASFLLHFSQEIHDFLENMPHHLRTIVNEILKYLGAQN